MRPAIMKVFTTAVVLVSPWSKVDDCGPNDAQYNDFDASSPGKRLDRGDLNTSLLKYTLGYT
mgnify:CR=1 FL=1